MHNRRFRAVSSVYGKIEHILFAYPGNDRDRVNLRRLYEEAYSKLPKSVQFFVFALFGSENDFEYGLDKFIESTRDYFDRIIPGSMPSERLQTVILGSHEELRGRTHEWVQDLNYVLESSNGVAAFLQQVHFRHEKNFGYSNSQIAEVIASETDFLLKPFPYLIVGGNILVGNTYMIVARDLLNRNAQEFQRTEEEITEAFRCGFGIEDVIWLDVGDVDGQNNLGHLDFIMNLGGKIYEDYTWKELVMLAEITEDSLSGGAAINDPDIQKYIRTLDRIAFYLESYNHDGLRFKVERVPLIVHNRPGRANPYIFRSYNNCLVEVYDRFKNAYLPRYYQADGAGGNRFDELESSIQRLYSRYGFTIHFLEGNFDALSDNRGSFRCISKVLRRSSADSRNWNIDFSHNVLEYNGNDRGMAQQYVDIIKEVLEHKLR